MAASSKKIDTGQASPSFAQEVPTSGEYSHFEISRPQTQKSGRPKTHNYKASFSSHGDGTTLGTSGQPHMPASH